MTKKILIVDDDYSFASFAKRLMEDCGFQGVVVRTGQAAVDSAKSQRPDLILLDLGLPDIDGLDVLKALKADAETAAIPVAICSMSHDAKALAQGLGMGAAKVLPKPLDPRIAVPEIKALLLPP